MSIFREFKTFAMRGNAIDLAVGIVVGAAFTAIVNSLVKDIINPPLGLALGGIDFSNFFITLKGGHELTPHEMEAAAMRQTKKLNRHGGTLKALHIDPSSIEPLRFYAVDTKQMKLVERKP